MWILKRMSEFNVLTAIYYIQSLHLQIYVKLEIWALFSNVRSFVLLCILNSPHLKNPVITSSVHPDSIFTIAQHFMQYVSSLSSHCLRETFPTEALTPQHYRTAPSVRGHRHYEDNPAASFKLKPYYHHEKKLCSYLQDSPLPPGGADLGAEWSCRTVNFFKTTNMWDLLRLTELTVTFRLIPTQILLLRKVFPFLKPAGDTEGHPSSYLWSPRTHHDDGVGDSGVVDGPGSHQTGHGRETAALWHTHTHIWSAPHWQAAACTHGPAP